MLHVYGFEQILYSICTAVRCGITFLRHYTHKDDNHSQTHDSISHDVAFHTPGSRSSVIPVLSLSASDLFNHENIYSWKFMGTEPLSVA